MNPSQCGSTGEKHDKGSGKTFNLVLCIVSEGKQRHHDACYVASALGEKARPRKKQHRAVKKSNL